MGFGALFAGHMHPAGPAAVEAQLDDGTLYVTPCELDAEVAELLAERYGLPMWRPTNSGTEATMDAIRLARGVTGREKLVKVEGGYHGHHDEVMVSKQAAARQGRPGRRPPTRCRSPPASQRGTLDDVIVIQYNDADALERVLRAGDVAAFIVEPVMENIGICLPQPGYLEAVREITQRHGTLLIFDEVKTGITAGYGGATGRLGVQPTSSRWRSRSAGDFPSAPSVARPSTWTSSPPGRCCISARTTATRSWMAAVKAVLTEACNPDAMADAIARNGRLVQACQDVIDRTGVPAHTVEFGAKGCVTWSRTPVRNYRDYLATNFDLAFAQWIHGINRGVLLPPGLDEQWLISVMHDEADAMRYASVFAEFVDELVA